MKRSKNSRHIIFRKYLIGLVIIVAVAWGAQTVIGATKRSNSSQAASTPQLRNDLRRENLKLIAGAFHRYIAEVGPVPVKFSASPTGICSGSSVNCKKYARADLAFLTSSGYLISVPNDPVGGHDLFSTGYTISKDAAGKLILQAPRAETGAVISQNIE